MLNKWAAMTFLEGGYDQEVYRKMWSGKRAQEVKEETANLPSRDLASQLNEAAIKIHAVAVDSGNLKGSF